MKEVDILIDGSIAGKRLDVAISLLCEDLTRSRIKTIIENGNITLNGNPVNKAGIITKLNDKIHITFDEPKQLSLEPCDMNLDIVYEDPYLAVVNKPQGMVTHPASGSPDGTLVNALLYQLKDLSDINGVIRPGIVHRLDKNTSGLLVIAKTNGAHLSLQAQISAKSAQRKYIALADGNIKADEGKVTINIVRSKKDRKLMTVSNNEGRYAETHYKVLERFGRYTLTEYELKTGRTHQIRVHSKFIGHPIVGDNVYGGSTKLYDKGQLLHAFKLSFNHPITGERMEFNADLPDYFVKVLEKLRSNA